MFLSSVKDFGLGPWGGTFRFFRGGFQGSGSLQLVGRVASLAAFLFQIWGVPGPVSCQCLPETPCPNLETRGCQNSGLGKRSFCLGDTRHFRHFRRLSGIEQNPVFLWVDCNSQNFCRFSSKPPVFGRGQKQPFSKTTVSTTPRNLCFRDASFADLRLP